MKDVREYLEGQTGSIGSFDDLREYAGEQVDRVKDYYLGHEQGVYDRMMEDIAGRIESIDTEFDTGYDNLDTALDYSSMAASNFLQGMSGSVFVASYLYDKGTATFLTDETQDRDDPLSVYHMIEDERDEPEDWKEEVTERTAKGAGFLTGAAICVKEPLVLLTANANEIRQYAERKLHPYLQDRLMDEEEESGPERRPLPPDVGALPAAAYEEPPAGEGSDQPLEEDGMTPPEPEPIAARD